MGSEWQITVYRLKNFGEYIRLLLLATFLGGIYFYGAIIELSLNPLEWSRTFRTNIGCVGKTSIIYLLIIELTVYADYRKIKINIKRAWFVGFGSCKVTRNPIRKLQNHDREECKGCTEMGKCIRSRLGNGKRS